jgi:hypothetical protein
VPDSHPFGQEWEQHLATTQRAYEERRLADYLAGFSDGYHSVQLGTRWEEDKEGLEAKMVKDFARFELLRMDFQMLRIWYAGQSGFAHLGYDTKLRVRDSGRVLVDRRENILTGWHLGAGRWLIDCKIVLKAENCYEDEQPEI